MLEAGTGRMIPNGFCEASPRGTVPTCQPLIITISDLVLDRVDHRTLPGHS